MKQIPIIERVGKVKSWFIQNSGMVPYIVCFGYRQWTDLLYQRYPENVLASFFAGRMTKAGSESQFIADYEDYHSSFLKLINDRKTLEKVYSDFLVDERNFKNFIDQILGKGESYLHEHFDEFMHVYDEEYISGAVIDGVIVYGEWFFNEMNKKYPAHTEELRVLTEQYGETFLNRYHQELIKLAIKLKNIKFVSVDDVLKNAEARSELEKVQKAFHWIKNNYKNVSALPVSFFAEQLFELLADSNKDYAKELNELVNFADHHKKECDKIKELAIFDSEDYEKVLWLGKIGWWVDRRKEYNLTANYYIGRHLEFLCKKYDLQYDDAAFLLPRELDEIVAGKKTMNDFPVKERKDECLYFRDIFGQELFLVGNEAKEVWKKINPPVTGSLSEVKGMVAFKGKVRGVARVIMDAHNPGEFNDGDILVTGMTRPDFLSLLKKSVAFVTDEGGITCHAAIVSRELKKPCIIGTKVATKVFKSGDLIEVDADMGTVRKIE